MTPNRLPYNVRRIYFSCTSSTILLLQNQETLERNRTSMGAYGKVSYGAAAGTVEMDQPQMLDILN